MNFCDNRFKEAIFDNKKSNKEIDCLDYKRTVY